MKKNYWNHRILANEYDGRVYFEIHEVHYENDKPVAYTKNSIPVGGEDIKTIKWVLKRMKRATKKPILWGGEKFPLVFRK